MSIASTLRGLASGAVGLAAPLALAACLEAQPTPELPSTPASAFTLTTLADGLDKPWAVAPLPDGGALVTEKPGRIWRVAADGTKSEVSGGPSPYYVDDPQSQAGLFDVVAAPDFAESGRVYVSSAVGTADANGTALFSYRLDGTALTDERELFRSRDPKDTNAHFGAKIAVLPDGTLALSTGDGFAYREAAQDLGSHLGKIVRVNADGSVPADNPYADSVRPEIWSWGHRNVQGLAVDPATGQLWEHEHGPRGGDELNRIEAGANYGWPVATTGRDYNGARISPFDRAAEFTPFVHQWTPSVAPSGLAVYRGDLFADWDGDMLVGALAGKSLRRLDMDDGQVVGEEVLLGDLGARIRDVRVAPDGSVWVLQDGAEGGASLLRLAPSSES